MHPLVTIFPNKTGDLPRGLLATRQGKTWCQRDEEIADASYVAGLSENKPLLFGQLISWYQYGDYIINGDLWWLYNGITIG